MVIDYRNEMWLPYRLDIWSEEDEYLHLDQAFQNKATIVDEPRPPTLLSRLAHKQTEQNKADQKESVTQTTQTI